jgi:signal transduction histidine kinase
MIANYNINLGDGYEKLNILDSARMYTFQAYRHAASSKDLDLVATAVNNLGNIYGKMRKNDSALYYYRQAKPLWLKADDYDGLCEATLGMAKIFRSLGMQDSSLFYARQSISAGWHGGFTMRVLSASQFLTTYFKQQGQTDSAFRYLEVSVAAKDSLFSQEKNKEVQNLFFAQRQRELDIKEKETAYRASVRFYLLIAVIVFLLVLAFVFWRNNRKNEKAKRLLQLQKEQIQTTLGELKTTQNQLVQSAKMASLGELTAGIAHEIQNPLNFVNNFSDVNREMIGELKGELKSGNVEEALAIADDIEQNEVKINHHGRRADFIVKGMLEHSRTSKGERQVTNLNVLADEFLKLSYHGLRAKDKNFNAELVTNFDNNLPKANVVQQDIGRVLINLFGNAFYAVNQKAKTAGTDFKPTVEVSTERQNGSILVKVKDNGNGIPDAIKDKIMQPFFTTKPTGEGTGLGLSLSYDIVVKGHNGSISVDTKEGEFTEFAVRLPYA